MTTRRGFIGSTISLSLLGKSAGSATQNFVLTIYRQYSSNKCTSGYLAAGDRIICYTLELPWQGNKAFISSIPVGEYPAIIRYDHPDKWRFDFAVPGRPHVQIHTGNTPDDSEGCILVGMQLNADLCSIKAGSSKQAYDALRSAFYGSANPVATPNKNILLRVAK